MQGLVELSTRLREATGHEIIDLNRVMGFVQFAYQQRELAQRGTAYAVDDFGFPTVRTGDRDPLVRFATGEMLVDLGHTIVQASSGGEALEDLKETRKTIL